MTWGVAFVLTIMAFPVIFFSAIGIGGHRRNRRIQHSSNSVNALRRRADQERNRDSHPRSTEP
ncbi:hypothetical protein [Amycolatopsis jejuensis]|uniref:hypothetical protein n=1 Tax=Amycolatopsis jejuensis TaxID=330084 RepID=UPI0012E00590|nr:hypothetical protein [Amycolatopsis jejuensis]